jgi:hypothetical protein
MLSFLPHDMFFEMISFLLPDEFQLMYLSVNTQLQNEMKQQTFVCKTVISNELIEWFQQNQINFQLKRCHYEIDFPNHDLPGYLSSSKYWLTNGLKHSENDEPAVIEFYSFNKRIVKYWYKNNVLHRDDDKPAVVSNSGYCSWFVNGNFYKII